MKSILDRSFVYVSAAATDIRKTFERIKAEAEKPKETEKKLNRIIQIKRVA